MNTVKPQAPGVLARHVTRPEQAAPASAATRAMGAGLHQVQVLQSRTEPAQRTLGLRRK